NSQPSSTSLQMRCHTEKLDSRHNSEHTDVMALDNTKQNPISSLTIIAQTPANAVSPASCTVEFTGGTKAKLSGTARDAISLSVDGQDPIARAETFLWGDYGEHYAVLKERRKVIRNIIVV